MNWTPSWQPFLDVNTSYLWCGSVESGGRGLGVGGGFILEPKPGSQKKRSVQYQPALALILACLDRSNAPFPVQAGSPICQREMSGPPRGCAIGQPSSPLQLDQHHSRRGGRRRDPTHGLALPAHSPNQATTSILRSIAPACGGAHLHWRPHPQQVPASLCTVVNVAHVTPNFWRGGANTSTCPHPHPHNDA